MHVGISGFGFSGTNAHVILRDAAAERPALDGAALDGATLANHDGERAVAAAGSTEDSRAGNGLSVLALSAKTEGALRASARRLRERLEGAEADEVADICFTATAKRTALEERAVLVAATGQALQRGLRALEEDRQRAGLLRGRRLADPGAVAFVFSGYGGQWPGMGKQLMRSSAVFRSTVESCAAVMKPLLGVDVAERLRSGAAITDQLDIEQPVLFALQLGLAEMLRQRRLVPEVVLGHSVGELAAAYFCGALSLPDAARIVCARSRALQALTGKGGMMVVPLKVDALLEYQKAQSAWEVAAINGPASTVVTGGDEELDALQAALASDHVQTKRVKIRTAAHSRQLEQHLPEFSERMGAVVPSAHPCLQFMSTVYGRTAATEELDQRYWLRNLREPVRFREAVVQLLEAGVGAFVEIGPSPVLQDAIQASIEYERGAALALQSLRRNGYAERDLLELAGQLSVRGAPVDWRAFGVAGRVVDIPSYPWEHKRYWSNASWQAGAGWTAGQVVVDAAVPGERLIERSLELSRTAWLMGHKVGSAVVVPAAFYPRTHAGRELELRGRDARYGVLFGRLSGAGAIGHGVRRRSACGRCGCVKPCPG